MTTSGTINLHYGVAEKGKVFALQGNHKEALRHYKEALRMCQSLPTADVFFQHYSMCAMESLELMESYDEVIAFCDKCLDFLESKDDLKDNPIFEKYVASILERKGIQYLFLNEKAEAVEAFKAVQNRIGKTQMPLTNELLNWASRGYTITTKQIRDLQKKHKYFTVRKEIVNEKIAIELPQNINPF
jgi:tetratricopeptide (TPR) repeat protein